MKVEQGLFPGNTILSHFRGFNVTLAGQDCRSNTVQFRSFELTRRALLAGGDFTEGENFPYGWRPGPGNVTCEKRSGTVSFTMTRAIAESEGMWMYSLFYPVSSPSTYTLTLVVKGSGQEAIVFVEGWGLVNGRRRRLERNECFFHPKSAGWENFSEKAVFTHPGVQWMRGRSTPHTERSFRRLRMNPK